MPVISRDKPVFASSAQYPAANANDASYGTFWRSSGPAWLAYDLSSVPAFQRGRVDVAWYNDPTTGAYDHALGGGPAYNNVGAYTIEANPGPGSGSPPTSGWVVLATVSGNTFHSRAHVVDMTGMNWIRINVTQTDGSTGNNDVMLNMDVHDASLGADDSWIFYGDFLTQDGMSHAPISSTGNYSQLVNATNSSYFPQFEDGGDGIRLLGRRRHSPAGVAFDLPR